MVAFLLADVGFAGAGDVLAKIPDCPMVKVSARPADWRREEVRGGFAFFLPPSCRPDPEPRRFVHGGASWGCDALGVDLVWGMWGPDSFGPNERQCRTTLAGRPAVLSISTEGKGTRYAVWYLTGDVHEPMVSAWSSTSEGVSLLRSITTSGVLTRAAPQ